MCFDKISSDKHEFYFHNLQSVNVGYMMQAMSVNATFSVVSMVIHLDAAVTETAQLACCLTQWLCVVQSSELQCSALFYVTDDIDE